ncbi:MAG: hypothetical protein AB7F75_03545 [Planctomycetota bacterium]
MKTARRTPYVTFVLASLMATPLGADSLALAREAEIKGESRAFEQYLAASKDKALSPITREQSRVQGWVLVQAAMGRGKITAEEYKGLALSFGEMASASADDGSLSKGGPVNEDLVQKHVDSLLEESVINGGKDEGYLARLSQVQLIVAGNDDLMLQIAEALLKKARAASNPVASARLIYGSLYMGGGRIVGRFVEEPSVLDGLKDAQAESLRILPADVMESLFLGLLLKDTEKHWSSAELFLTMVENYSSIGALKILDHADRANHDVLSRWLDGNCKRLASNLSAGADDSVYESLQLHGLCYLETQQSFKIISEIERLFRMHVVTPTLQGELTNGLALDMSVEHFWRFMFPETFKGSLDQAMAEVLKAPMAVRIKLIEYFAYSPEELAEQVNDKGAPPISMEKLMEVRRILLNTLIEDLVSGKLPQDQRKVTYALLFSRKNNMILSEETKKAMVKCFAKDMATIIPGKNGYANPDDLSMLQAVFSSQSLELLDFDEYVAMHESLNLFKEPTPFSESWYSGLLANNRATRHAEGVIRHEKFPLSFKLGVLKGVRDPSKELLETVILELEEVAKDGGADGATIDRMIPNLENVFSGEQVVNVVANESLNPLLRRRFVDLLPRNISEGVRERLSAVLANPNEPDDIVIQILQWAKKSGDFHLTPAITLHLDSSNADIRQHAIQALEQIKKNKEEKGKWVDWYEKSK